MTPKKTTSLLLLAGALIIVGSSFFSCTKDSPIKTTKADTVYITKHDTIFFRTDTLTRTQILTQKPWRVDQLIHVITGQYSAYLLGGTNTTGINYDNLRFTFKADGTGTTTDQFGTVYNLSWHFTTPDQRTMSITTNSITYTWSMVELAGTYLHATAGPLTVSGNANNMEAFRLIQYTTN